MSIAGRTYRELQDEVLEFQFAESKYRPLVKTWLNDAQRIVVRESEIRTQQEAAAYTTESGTAELALPTDYARLIDFRDTEEGLLAPLSVEEYDALLPASSPGRPAAYAVVGSHLIAYPTPDAPYPLALRYWRLPEDMVSDSDEPEIPAQYHALLPAYPMQKAFARENDYTASTFWKTEWESGLLKMRGEVQSDSFDGPSQVSGSWGDPHEAPVTEWR